MVLDTRGVAELGVAELLDAMDGWRASDGKRLGRRAARGEICELASSSEMVLRAVVKEAFVDAVSTRLRGMMAAVVGDVEDTWR